MVFAIAMTTGCGGDDVDYGILRVVPNDAGVIIKANDLTTLCSSLGTSNAAWNQLRKMPQMKTLDDAINTLDTLIRNNHKIKSVLDGQEAVISFHKEGLDKVHPLIAVKIDKQKAIMLLETVRSIAIKQNKKFTTKRYDHWEIYSIESADEKHKTVYLSMSYASGFLLASTSKITAEQTVRHIATKDGNITQDPSLKQLLKSARADRTAALIFDYNKLNEMLGASLQKGKSKISTFAQYSVLDIELEKNTIRCYGYTDSPKARHILSVIRSQKPVENSCQAYLPSKTTSFFSMGLSDVHSFADDYHNHLRATDTYTAYRDNDKHIDVKYGIELADILYSSIGKRITEFTCTYGIAGRANDSYIVAELKNPKDFESKMSALCKTARSIENIADKDGLFNVKTSAGKSYRAYKFPIKHMFSSYFGQMFSVTSDYMMMYNGNAVFGASVDALYEYANNVDNGKVLSSNSMFDSYDEYLTPESNLFYYIDIAYSQGDVASRLNNSSAAELKKNYRNLQDIRSTSLQYSHVENDLYYTNASMMYSNIIEADRCVSWLAKADTSIISKPQVFTDKSNNDKEIFVQDETNKIYLFDKNGKCRLVKQIGEPLVSHAIPIDCYGNGNRQYVFATEHFIYALDRKGRFLDNFPVELPASLSSEISVFDYEGTHDYRIFVPCSDRRLYVYTKEGVQLSAWSPFVTNEPVITPVQHFRINENDYLVFADNLKTYIINRRGEIRTNVTNTFSKSKNSLYYREEYGGETRLVTSNSSGEIKYIYSDGSTKSKSFNHLTANHHFVLQDLDGDGSNEYIFTDKDKLYVYNADGTEIFTRDFDGSIGRPTIFTFSARDVRIGVTCRSCAQLYLIDNKGKICKGFPLQGVSEFSIAKLNSSDKFSILTGNTDNYLYNYWIQ